MRRTWGESCKTKEMQKHSVVDISVCLYSLTGKADVAMTINIREGSPQIHSQEVIGEDK